MPKLSNQVKPIASEQEYLDRVFNLEFNLTAGHNLDPKPADSHGRDTNNKLAKPT